MTFTWLRCPGGCGRRLSCPTDAIMAQLRVNDGSQPATSLVPYESCVHEGGPCPWFVGKLLALWEKR